MHDLSEINVNVQQFVEAIASNIDVDISVVNKERTVVAGTGWIKDKVGKQYDPNCFPSRLLKSGHAYYTRNPGQCRQCKPCSRYGVCEHLAMVAFPIRKDNQIVGCLCLEPSSERQKQILLVNTNSLFNLVDKMCSIMFDALTESELEAEFNTLAETHSKVLNTVQEAIIVTDKANNITQINTSAIRLLELDRANLIDQPILSIFPTLNFPLPQTNCSQFDTKNTCQNADRTKQFYINVEIITDPGNKDYLGSVVVLKSLNQVRAITNKFNPNYSKYCFDDIKGSSASIGNVKEKLRKAALTDATILIRGESGTGKELFAHAIHAASHRAKNNFTAINCSAIPDALLESELFGYEEGAFTGAKKGGKPGKLELAKGGTIFLDEIGDMPLHLQCKLLRVIENRIIERVGGTEQILVDVRFIAATNKDLEKMVAENDFRSDLYYRLSVIPVMVPPLRDRGGDIGILINYFLNMYSNKMNIPEPIIDQQVKEVLLNYAWPGNVREMQNTLQYLISMSQDEPIATMKHLPSKFFEISAHTQSNDKMLNQTEELFDLNIAGKGTLHSAQEQLVGQALQKFGCTTEGKVKAAKYLGISLTTLYRKIREINDSNNLQNLN